MKNLRRTHATTIVATMIAADAMINIGSGRSSGFEIMEQALAIQELAPIVLAVESDAKNRAAPAVKGSQAEPE